MTAPGRAARLALRLIRGYQVALSPWVGRSCRYLPTCSVYMSQSIARFGLLRGGWLGLRRLLRCHPWGASGLDPVPVDYVWWGRGRPS
jgi:hypothetical protein